MKPRYVVWNSFIFELNSKKSLEDFLKPLTKLFSHRKRKITFDHEKVVDLINNTPMNQNSEILKLQDLGKKDVLKFVLMYIFRYIVDNKLWGHEELDIKTSPYVATVSSLNKIEHNRLIQVKGLTEESEILTRFQISRLIVKYQTLNSYINLYPSLNETILGNSKVQHATFTTGLVILPENSSHCEQKVLTIQETLEDHTNLETMFTRIHTIFACNKDAKMVQDFFYWPGTGMSFPKNVRISFDFNDPYPSLFVWHNSGQKLDLKESAWNIDFVASKGFYKIGPETKNHQLKTATTYLSSSVECIQQGSISKQKYVNVLRHNSAPLSKGSPQPFNTNLMKDLLKVVIDIQEKFEDCEVVIQLPYYGPRADSLLAVTFDGEADSEIIMTTT